MKFKKKINYKKNHKSILVDSTNPWSEYWYRDKKINFKKSIEKISKLNIKKHRKKSQVNLINLWLVIWESNLV